MFHAFDSQGTPPPLSRPAWMADLARAPLDLLESALADHLAEPPRWLRPPETGLMMVQGRVGGTGERFNVGEVTVTRCALRLPAGATASDPATAAVGVAYVLGRSHRQARLAALADALLQDPARRPALETALLQPVRRHLAARRAERHARHQGSKVEFFTVAREAGEAGEAGGAGAEGDEA